jgi:hypothetical protein
MARERHALLIGVGDNPQIRKNAPRAIRTEYSILRGSEPDVEAVRELLVERCRFPADHVRVLKTRQATQRAILEAVDDLVARVGKDDVVAFYYSGHGSRMRDPYNPGRWLQTLAPYDTGRGSAENRDIPDVEIDRWVRRLNDKTPHVTLIFDCCHSGTITRDPFAEGLREIEEDPRPPEEMFAGGRVPAIFAGSRGLADKPRLRSGWLPVGRRAVVVAACRELEQAAEVELPVRRDGRPASLFHGLLTLELQRALAGADAGATWRDVLEQVAPRVIADKPDQHPQIEGEIDRLVFEVGEARARPYLPVVAADGDGVELWGGGAHAVAEGSLWTVRPHGARRRSDGDEVARVRIAEVRGATSRATVVGGAPDGLAAGQRAFLLEHQLPDPGLRLGIDAPGDRRRALEEEIAATGVLAAAEDPRQADAVVRRLEPRSAVAPGDPCPALGPLAAPTWAAVGRDGTLQTRPRAETDDAVDAIAGIAGDLVHLARVRNLRRHLENPDPESRLRGRVELAILRCPPGRRAEVAAIDEAFGLPVVADGERVDFEIRSRHDGELWVSLVELAADHSVTVLMPHRRHPTFRRGGWRLGPGETVRVGRDYWEVDEGLEQVLPEGFPWAAEEGRGEALAVSWLTLLVTSVPADFEFLAGEGVRFTPSHPLERLALLYHSGSGSRRVVLPAEEVKKDRDWTAATRLLGIRRRTAV